MNTVQFATMRELGVATTIAEERREAWVPSCPIEDAMEYFTCFDCGRLVHYDDGCADDMPASCSRCWMAAHGGDETP